MERVDGSSSASVSDCCALPCAGREVGLKLLIVSIEATSADCVKLTIAGGGVSFLRVCYLCVVSPCELQERSEFNGDEEADIIQAIKCSEAERMAMALLDRAEQSRHDLMRKLAKKGIDQNVATRALDYLEERGFLSDERYARAYLTSRRMRYEGRAKKAANLAIHGIDRDVAKTALDEFFTEYPEEEICLKALQKGLESGKTRDRLGMSLVRKGFSASMVRHVMRNMNI